MSIAQRRICKHSQGKGLGHAPRSAGAPRGLRRRGLPRAALQGRSRGGHLEGHLPRVCVAVTALAGAPRARRSQGGATGSVTNRTSAAWQGVTPMPRRFCLFVAQMEEEGNGWGRRREEGTWLRTGRVGAEGRKTFPRGHWRERRGGSPALVVFQVSVDEAMECEWGDACMQGIGCQRWEVRRSTQD